MLLLLVLALVEFGSAVSIDICYGSSYELPLYYTPPLYTGSIYYKPRGEERTLVVSDGQSRNKRFKVSTGQIIMEGLTAQDDRATLLFDGKKSITLGVEECQDVESSSYGDLFSWRVPYGAAYLEFSHVPSSGSALKPQVIWNRTDSSVGKGTVKRNYYELSNLKQKDSGYYKFMSSGDQIVKWKRLEVTEYDRHLEYMEGENLEMDFPMKFPGMQRCLFTPDGSDYERIYERGHMSHRMVLTDSYVTLLDLLYEDSGTYKFMDSEGFVATRLQLVVHPSHAPTWVYVVAVMVIVFAVVFCCCCVKKCCCKKKSKRDSPQSEPAAPPVFYHGTTQPTQPVIPLLSREPRANTPDPPMYSSGVTNVRPEPTTQVTASGGLGPTSTSENTACSDSDPKFEFKGTTFPFSSPLSSGTSIQDVYTSDKLNFL